MPTPEGDTDSLVRSLFKVNDSFQLPDGETEYRIVHADDTKPNFEKLNDALAPRGFAPWLTGSEEDCILTVRKKQPVTPSKSRIPLIMALFTFASIIVVAIIEVEAYGVFAQGVQWYAVLVEFVGCVWLILLLHELGRRLISRRTRTTSPTPYVVPGVPTLTFFLLSLGIISSQREPAVNRDQLFDVMVAGPMLVLAAAVLLYVIGGLASVQSTLPAQGVQIVNGIPIKGVYPSVLQFDISALLSPFIAPSPPGLVRLSPIADAASFGFPLTFVSFLPMAFFDGGYLLTTVYGSRYIRAATYLSVLVLIVIDTPDYWALAIVVLLMAARPFDVQTRDDLSGISRGRKALYLAMMVMAILSLPIPQNLATFPLG
ncbi:MAG TPA: hypothetical protein VKF15_00250 [Nitrososphaerales archaeon]|nr:hypothetical protein [Nitrososphaerales archaeon]